MKKYKHGSEIGSGIGGGHVADFSVHDFRVAIGRLNELNDSSRLREDAIRNGRAIVRNWQPPTASQIDKIICDMKRRLQP